LNFPNVQIYYGDIKKASKKTLVDEECKWSKEMRWGATKDKRLIVEISEFSKTEQAQIESPWAS
jgi:hypothetical protein